MAAIAAHAARIVDILARIGAGLSAAILVAMIGGILVEIALRNLWGTSLGYVGELVGYGVAASTFNALAYAFGRNALIRVTLIGGLVRRFPAVGVALQALALLLTLAVVGLATVYFWDSVVRHFERGSVGEGSAEFPLWIAEGLMLTGLALFCAQLAVALLNLVVGNREHAGPPLVEVDATWGERARSVGEP